MVSLLLAIRYQNVANDGTDKVGETGTPEER